MPASGDGSENSRRAERRELLRLLEEYTNRVEQIAQALDRAKQRRLVLALALAAVASATVLAFLLLAALFRSGDAGSLSLLVLDAGLGIAFVIVFQLLIEQRTRSRVLRLDLQTSAAQLRQVHALAAAVEQNTISSSLERLEFNLRLTDAARLLRYLGAIE